ncbi:PepSY-associated TM helix domain-containing protein [Fodinicola feengrottensis]|uniref:PepSY-associated TM helix domain-containing protein n=1 Tax=Fodinicola feengrottensis TaxID=435914 RepID=A0ABN2FUF8_9ACTN
MSADVETQPVAEVEESAALTRTEAAARKVRSGSKFRRWWRRRPMRRSLVLTHRWTSLVLGLFLIAETTSGAIVLYNAEFFHATHGSFYQHTTSAHPITAQTALETVRKAHPEFGAAWVSSDNGVFAIGDEAYEHVYGVDPGSGRITGLADLNGGPMGFLVNLHDCGLGCKGYPGYVPFLGATMEGLGINWLATVTWGEFILFVLGLLMVLLAISGLITWWPGFRRFWQGWRVRTKKGRFARDYDLHNIIGMIALPFLFMWGLTGAAIYVQPVANVWLTITGGHAIDESRFDFAPHKVPKGTPDIGVDAAVRVALQHYPGRLAYLTTPEKLTPGYYSVSIAGSSYSAYEYRAFYSGDTTVMVDSHDPKNVKVVDTKGEPLSNVFYDKVFEARHFGWLVNPWWRIIWFVLGLAPLALAVTALSTWLFRHGNKKRRRHAKKAAAAT